MCGSEGVFARLTGADADRLFDGRNEDFTIADLVGLGGIYDGLDCAVDLIVGKDHFDFDFRKEVHDIFSAAIQLGMALLAAEAFDFDHAEALNANIL
jgi:hypothetical protein